MSYKPKNMWIIDFEGLDRSGKTTTKVALAKRLNQFVLCYDRGTLSLEAYDMRYKRHNFTSQAEDYMIAYPFHMIAYHYCSKEDFEKRKEQTNHEDIDFELDTECFIKALENHKKHGALIVTLNTSELSTEECVDKILGIIQNYEKLYNIHKLGEKK
ncbi:MAG: hypothetical protein IJ122_06285 [Methanobrevibacter sp.]|nr:hypothetical protein [Methanobrevibacter sp.]